MGKYFGTDGFRGEANVVLTVEHAFKVGRYLGWYFGQEHKARIVIGKDTRRSSYMFEYALAAGLTASGADAYLLHVTTTPSVSYAEVEEKIEAYIDGKIGEVPLATKENIGRTVDYAAGRNRYIGHLIALATRSFKDMKVGLDCANGSSSSIAKSVFDALGAKTYVINNEPNGVNINTNCGSTHIEVLQAFVKEKKLDVGFAYDGDADRCIAVDENGNVVDGDRIMYVCGKYLMEQGRLADHTIVTTIMSNLGLYKACDKIGMKYEQTAVGDKYVYENMLQNGYVLGGEQSGHIIFSKHARTGDGILTSLMVMEAILEKKQSLGTLADEVKIFPQLLKNVRVKDKRTALDNEAVQKAIEQTAEELGSDGRILVRESGTEPVIRVMVEAASDEICEKYVDGVVKIFEQEGLCE